MDLSPPTLVLSALTLFAGCASYETAPTGPPGSSLVVQADIKQYSPVMSIAPGIGLTPKYAGGEHPPFIRFHWSTNYGYFVEWEPPDHDVKTLGMNTTRPEGKIYWSYDPLAMDDEKPPVIIHVTVQDVRTEKAMTKSRINLVWKNLDTAVIAR